MCDDDIHQGLVEDWRVSRRAFVATGLVAGVAGRASAAAEAAVVAKDVMVKTADGSADAALFHPPGKGPWPAVLMWPDIMGLRPVFRDMGRRLAAEGYVVLVPNPFYRSKRAPVIEGALDFNDPETRKTLFGYRNAMSNDGIDKDATAYLAFLDAQAESSKRTRAGVQGYCMGGPLAFRTGAMVANRIGAVATFHGGGLVTDKPDSPHLLIPKTHASFLCCVARNDDAKSPQDKETLKAAFKAAGRPATVEVYNGDHGWTVAGSQVYNRDEAERAWAALTMLYKRALV